MVPKTRCDNCGYCTVLIFLIFVATRSVVSAVAFFLSATIDLAAVLLGFQSVLVYFVM
ncbi:uncharacterized protein EV420DRAFT_1510377, partial [Desarmillaria tabescens]